MKRLLGFVIVFAVAVGGFLPAVHAHAPHTESASQDISAHTADHSSHSADGALHDAIHHTHVESSTPVTVSVLKTPEAPVTPALSCVAILSSITNSVPYQPPRQS